MSREDAPSGERALRVLAPYRAGETQMAPAAPPEHFFVRESDGELVVERRRLDWLTLLKAGLIAVLGGSFALGFPSSGLLVFSLVGSTMWALGTLMGERYRTTLTLGPYTCTLVNQQLLGSERLEGTPDSFEIVEVKKLAGAWAIELSIGGQRTRAFVDAPREHLDWALARIAAWKRARAAEEPAGG